MIYIIHWCHIIVLRRNLVSCVPHDEWNRYNVIPDLVWISQERLAVSVDDSGHLTAATELIIEVLSPSINDIRRDKDTKLKLYSNRGVQEYWIADYMLQQIKV